RASTEGCCRGRSWRSGRTAAPRTWPGTPDTTRMRTPCRLPRRLTPRSDAGAAPATDILRGTAGAAPVIGPAGVGRTVPLNQCRSPIPARWTSGTPGTAPAGCATRPRISPRGSALARVEHRFPHGLVLRVEVRRQPEPSRQLRALGLQPRGRPEVV